MDRVQNIMQHHIHRIPGQGGLLAWQTRNNNNYNRREIKSRTAAARGEILIHNGFPSSSVLGFCTTDAARFEAVDENAKRCRRDGYCGKRDEENRLRVRPYGRRNSGIDCREFRPAAEDAEDAE